MLLLSLVFYSLKNKEKVLACSAILLISHALRASEVLVLEMLNLLPVLNKLYKGQCYMCLPCVIFVLKEQVNEQLGLH